MQKHFVQISKFYDPVIGGVETVVRDLAHMSLELGFTSTVICANREFKLETTIENIDGVKVIRCSSLGTFASMPISFSLLYQMWRYRNERHIFIHEQFPLASLFSLFIPFRYGYSVFWHFDIVKQKFFKKIVSIFQKFYLKQANSIITTSSRLAKHSDMIAPFRDKIQILPLTLSKKPTPQLEQPPELTKLSKPYILFCGRLVYYKGIHVFLEALAICAEKITLPPVVIAGVGKEASVVSDSIKTSKCEIHFINRYVSDAEKDWLFANCLFFAFPSNVRTEAFGITQLEAMSQSKAIINTDLPTGVPEVAPHDECSITIAANDAQKLAEAICEFVNNPDLVSRYGESAKKRFEDVFSWDVVKQKFAAFIG